MGYNKKYSMKQMEKAAGKAAKGKERMLRLDNITKIYPSGDVTALRGISLSFRKNEFVSILGPSGCGKTTLLNIVGGLDRYTDGELLVRHVPTAKFTDRDWDTYRNHSIGFVFQSYNLIPHQSVLANVELALTLSGVPAAERKRRAEEALRSVGLGDQLKKKPSQMSGGQMQRVAIARALVNNPDILLADEPTGALDSETSVQVMEILREVAKDKLVIMVTHNPDLAQTYSNRIIRFLDGKIVSDSNPYSPEDEAAESYETEETAGKTDAPAANAAEKGKRAKKRRTSMSFGTALGLSMNNLMTKKTRTLLTAFAGSIGIIGIALILSLSNGIQLYIDKVQEDTLSAYPIQIMRETVDMTSIMTAMMSAQEDRTEELASRDPERVYSNVMMYDLMDTMMSVDVQENNLNRFLTYIEENSTEFDAHASALAYGYDAPLTIYSLTRQDQDGMPTQLNPSEMFSGMMGGMTAGAGSAESAGGSAMQNSAASMMTSGLSVWQEMIDNGELMEQQYDLLAGEWPDAWNEIVLVVDEHNEINDVYLYALGLKDPAELEEMMAATMQGEKFNAQTESWSFDELLGMEFALVLPSDTYRQTEDGWEFMGDNASFMQVAVQNGERLVLTGILRPNEEAVATSLSGAVGYLPALTEHVIDLSEKNELVTAQLASPDTDVLNGLPFATEENDPDHLPVEERAAIIRGAFETMSAADKAAAYTHAVSTLDDETAAKMAAEKAAAMPEEAIAQMVRSAMIAQSGMEEAVIDGYIASMDEAAYNAMAMQILTAQVKAAYEAETEARLGQMTTAELATMMDQMIASLPDEAVAEQFGNYMPAVVSDSTYEANLKALGWVNREDPTYLKIYSDSFESKDEISRIIAEYNATALEEGREEDVIHYTDYVELMMSSISTIIDVISYVLIAFVSISLVVSSIMIGIITYISVLERTKEIGILRAVGASKKDISRVFNAETFIVGLTSGSIGIIVTILLCIPANMIIKHLTDISNLAKLPFEGGVALIVISMILTVVAGLIPSRLAAKKDPVEALRNE